MPVDGCAHSFQHLANVVLPAHMARMREAMKKPISMQTFAREKHGAATCAKHLGLKRDFSGCYVLMDKGTPVYTGISRTVLKRLISHVRGDNHNTASLAYLIAAQRHPHEWTRTFAMDQDSFREEFRLAQRDVCRYDAALIEIDCPVELYGFELCCSMELDTYQWNSFRTH